MPTEQFMAQKAALGKEFTGKGMPESIRWANESIETARKKPENIRAALKAGSEIGNQSILRTEELKTQVETIGKEAIDPETGKKVTTRVETENLKKANDGRELVEIFAEYGQLNPNIPKDQKKMEKLEERMVSVLEARPDGTQLFFPDPKKGVPMTDAKKCVFARKMLKNGGRELHMLVNEEAQALINDPNKPSTASESVIGALERYKDAEFNRDNAQIDLDTAKSEHQQILDDEQSFLDAITPGALGEQLKSLSDSQPGRLADILTSNKALGLLNQHLEQLNIQQEQLVRVKTTNNDMLKGVRQQLNGINRQIWGIRQQIADQTNQLNQMNAEEKKLATLQERKKNLPQEKIQREKAIREAQKGKVVADGEFTAASEDLRIANRLREKTETYFADALYHLPDHIINKYLDGKMDEVAVQIEEAIPFLNEKLREKLILGLDEKHYYEGRRLWKYPMHINTKKEKMIGSAVRQDWRYVVDGKVTTSPGVVETLETRVKNLIGGEAEWKALTEDQQKAVKAVYAVEVTNRYMKMKQERFFRTKVLGQQLITEHEFRELKKHPWNADVMEASARANQQFREAMEQQLPGVDLTTTEGKGRMWDIINKDNVLYALMMAVSVTPALLQEEKPQQS